MANFLLDSTPLVVSKELIRAVGRNEAEIVQQIHYWCEINKREGRNFHDGRYWTYNTYDEWAEELFWYSKSTIVRLFKKLEDSGIIISGNYNKMRQDRTKWYAVNYESLEKLGAYSQNDNLQVVSETTPLPKRTTTNNNKEIKAQTSRSRTSKFLSTLVAKYGEYRVADAVKAVNDYIDADYPSLTKRAHPQEGKYKRAVFAEKLLRCADETDTDDEIVFDALLIALERCPADVDPQIYYATSDKVLGNALMATGEIGFEQIQKTDYDFNE